jgi:hypothetical protein
MMPDKDENTKVLRRLADFTGGEFYVARNPKPLHDVWLKVAGGSRSQYTIGYVSTNAKRDGLFRNLRIVARNHEGKLLQVRTRAGYIVPASDPKVGSKP